MSFDIEQRFLSFALLGAGWVMWLLLILSVISVAIMIERLIFLRRNAVDIDRLQRELREFLANGDLAGAQARYGASQALEIRVGLAGMKEAARGAAAAEEAMVGEKARRRGDYERYLAVLGTLGNNAPFLGLFGTVLGIIKAFRDLSSNTQQGSAAVMAGISEALVATAIGILVAIPAVVAFNFFSRRVRRVVAHADALMHSLLAELKGEPPTKQASH